MPDMTSLGWMLSPFGVAVVGLYLLDRSHREARKQLTEQIDHERDQHAVVVRLLEGTLDALNRTPSILARHE